MQSCLFCGGDASEPGHACVCDGRQGAIEAAEHAADMALLISGLTDDTYATSEAAAVINDAELRATQRAEVYAAIRAAGDDGRTDDELQRLLSLDGSSERPRRWELWKQNLITIRRDGDGEAVKRLTRTNRRAVVWVDSSTTV